MAKLCFFKLNSHGFQSAVFLASLHEALQTEIISQREKETNWICLSSVRCGKSEKRARMKRNGKN